jgi:hypothetical protein
MTTKVSGVCDVVSTLEDTDRQVVLWLMKNNQAKQWQMMQI